MDPLAESYYPYSPYNYVLNNPIILIDPDGMMVDPPWWAKALAYGNGILNSIGSNATGGAPGTRMPADEAYDSETLAEFYAMGQGAGDKMSIAGGTGMMILSVMGIGGEVTAAPQTGGSSLAAITGTAAMGAEGALLAWGGLKGIFSDDRRVNMNDGDSGGNSNNIPENIHEGQQGKHIEGHNNYQEGKSILETDAQSLLNDFHAGNVESSTILNSNKVTVNFGKIIGKHIGLDGKSTPTSVGIIHHGKKGAHIVPSRPN